MIKYQIADFIVEAEFSGARLLRLAAPYRASSDSQVDFVLDARSRIEADVPKIVEQARLVACKDFESLRRLNGGRDFDLDDVTTTREELEYVATGAVFFSQLLRFGGIGLHASAVVYDGFAYLFSASSGVGKSTHTQLWRRAFGFDKTLILNDDKPALRKLSGRWFAYGAPWSGKSDLNAPLRFPVGGIAFLERSSENWIRPLSASAALFPFLNQTLRPLDKANMTVALDRAVELLEEVPIFRLGCLPNEEAARVAYESMRGGGSCRSAK